MNKRNLALLMFISALSALAGCHNDLSLRTQRYFESGKRLSAEGRYKEASIQFLNALRADEDFPEARFALAQTYEHMGKFAAAVDELDRTVDDDPTNYKARIEYGKLLFANGRIDEARAQADAVLETEPDNPEGHALLSAIASSHGETDRALKEIRRAIELNPSRSAYHENLALLEAGDPARVADVESELKSAVALDPKSLNAKLLLASFYARNNQLAQAEKVGWDAVNTEPSSLTARANVAEIILREGDQARAEQVLRQAETDFLNHPQAERILADYYADTGQFAKARSEFATLSAKYPKDTSIQSAYVRLLIRAGDYPSAQALLSSFAKVNSRDPEIATLEAIVSLQSGSTSDALAKLRSNAKSFPQDAFFQYWLGKAALAAGDLDLAQTSFQRAFDINQSAVEVQEALANIAIASGNSALLDEVAQGTLTSAHSANGYLWRAMVRLNGNSGHAEADLKTAIQIDPQLWRAYIELGKLRIAEQRPAEAESLLERALAGNPNSVEALRLLIEGDLTHHQPTRAIDRVNAQIQRTPLNSRLYDLLGRLQIQSGNLDKAAAAARKAVELNTADGDAVMLFAQTATIRGITASAVDAWQQRSKEHPGDAGALAILGALEESRGNSAKAKSYYQASLRQDPSQPVAANNLAYRMILDGESIDQALPLAEKGRLGMPDSPNTADTLGWAYYLKGNYQSARNLLEDAMHDEPDSAAIQYHLGMTYRKLQDKHNAQLHLKKALFLTHDPQTAKDVRKALQDLS